jgi:hypothetical protein
MYLEYEKNDMSPINMIMRDGLYEKNYSTPNS